MPTFSQMQVGHKTRAVCTFHTACSSKPHYIHYCISTLPQMCIKLNILYPNIDPYYTNSDTILDHWWNVTAFFVLYDQSPLKF